MLSNDKSGSVRSTSELEDNLRIINEMIETSKTNIKHNSIFFLLWGWLVLGASLIHFILIRVDYVNNWLPWPILMILGSIASVIIGFRLGKRSRVWSYFDKMMVYLWWGFFFTITLLIIVTLFGKIPWQYTQPMIIALYGLGTFVSGGILRFKPLIIGGLFSWICSIAAFFLPYEYGLLLVAVSMLVAYLIPGYILKAKNRKQ